MTSQFEASNRHPRGGMKRGSLAYFHPGSVCLPAILLGASVPAQDALQLSLSNQGAAAQRRLQLENIPYTVRLGDFKLLASGSLAEEYNNNVNLANTNSQEDFISRPMVNGDVYWPVTEVNLLTFSMGLGYAKFAEHGQYDQWVITPNSALGWDLYVKNWQFNFHDQFSYSQDPTAYGAVSGTATFGGFQNTAGVLASWDLHDVVLSFGYDHYNYIADSSTYEYLSRASDFFTLRSSFKVHATATAGVELSGGPTAYDLQGLGSLPNNTTYSAGLFATWKPTQQLQIEPRVGYYIYDFAGGESEQTGYYFSLKLSHAPRASISYNLEVGNRAYMGNNSALTEEWYGQAGANWHIARRLTLSGWFRYAVASQPIGSSYSAPYDFTSLDVTLSRPIGEKLTVSVEYRWYLKNSDYHPYDYDQDRLTLNLAYTF